ncbi:MAG: S-layer homology domain-containing protein [Xenococcaceae cyanobacterium MO_188.B29]|nr:S-layer homology domain-containing protein [Xenococcaceae cyanobacterium MO_188.B29]
MGTDCCLAVAIAMTNFSPPPDPSQSPEPRRPILSFDEIVAIVVAFVTIGAILFWSWGGRKGKMFSQTWQKLKSTVEDTAVLETETKRSFDIRLSRDSEVEERDVAVLPETPSQPEQPSLFRFSRTDRSPKTLIGDSQQPIIVLPTSPVTETPPTTEETPTPPVTETPPTTEETPTPPVTETPPTTEETPTPPVVTFDDVPPNHWAYPFIEPLIEKELIVGISDNEFQPDLPITRAQLASEIETAFKQETNRDLITFEDISKESQAAKKIDEAVKTGFLKGYPGQVFRPDQKVPRLQVLVALVSGLDLKTSQDPEAILSSYQDSGQIPNWAREQIAAAIESGLVVNRPDFTTNSLYPNEPATRAEVVGMIYQGLVKAGRIEQISSPYVVPSP